LRGDTVYRRVFVYLILISPSLSSCISSPGPSEGGENQLDRRREWKAAPLDEGGRATTLTVRYEDREEAVPANGDFSVLLVWTQGEQAFYLFDTEAKTMMATRDFDGILRALDDLPRASDVVWIDTCCVSRMWGMPDPARGRLADTRARMMERGIVWAEPVLVCICESRGVGRSREIPLTPDLAALLKSMRGEVLKKEEATPPAIRQRFVFVNPATGTRWVDTKVAWRSALKKAGLVGLRFHDLRHYAERRIMPSASRGRRLLGAGTRSTRSR
jgi:hypothetical protein